MKKGHSWKGNKYTSSYLPTHTSHLLQWGIMCRYYVYSSSSVRAGSEKWKLKFHYGSKCSFGLYEEGVLTDSISGNDCVLYAIFCWLMKADGTGWGTPGADVTSTRIWRWRSVIRFKTSLLLLETLPQVSKAVMKMSSINPVQVITKSIMSRKLQTLQSSQGLSFK